jgi:hypothetical protein
MFALFLPFYQLKIHNIALQYHKQEIPKDRNEGVGK